MKKIWPKQNIRNILCVRLDNMGDVLMCSPAMRALRENGAKLTLLCSRAGKNIAGLIPEIDDAMVLQAPWVKRDGHLPSQDGAVSKMISEIQSRCFDAAVIFTTYSQSALPAALLCYLGKVPLRAAYCRENPYELINWWLPEPEPQRLIRHEVQRQLHFVNILGYSTRDKSLSLTIPRPAREAAYRKLTAWGISGDDWYILHPGASASSRRYPADFFAEVIRQLYIKKNVAVLTGNKAELEIIKRICRILPGGAFRVDVTLEIEELAALIQVSPLLISNNTGPIHIAAALQTPVVVLYALTNPQHTPWNVLSKVLFYDVSCKFCYKSDCPEQHHLCLRRVHPDQVVESADSIMRLKKEDHVHARN
ncbi:MAG: glycosyltransferase family 9 protein [Candidatus Omnitrophica bacterium]|nr:glycosyltransferase family 9 protein [Candidatus Omnitrophota bacterium]MDD5553685.1 glycosyltransferase family 9 protein [Candidatus Omnitrophota bacterium]